MTPPEAAGSIAEAFATIETNLRSVKHAVEDNPGRELDVIVRLGRVSRSLFRIYRDVKRGTARSTMRVAGASDYAAPDGEDAA